MREDDSLAYPTGKCLFYNFSRHPGIRPESWDQQNGERELPRVVIYEWHLEQWP